MEMTTKRKEKKMTLTSPLEELSQAYNCNGPHELDSSWEAKIFDDTQNQVLYIVPAGFTQRNKEGRSRTSFYKALYQKAVSFETEKKLNPFGLKSHSVILHPEPQNQYDKNAIRVGIRFDDYSKTPPWFKPQVWQDIGYIPKVISKLLKKNFKMLGHGTILSVHAIHDRDIYFSRVAIPYGEKLREELFVNQKVQRYNAIMEE